MNIKQFASKYAPIAITAGWAALGFRNGWETASRRRESYSQPFYVDKFLHGIVGAAIYMFPLTLPLGVYSEILGLEKKIRGLDDFGNKREK